MSLTSDQWTLGVSAAAQQFGATVNLPDQPQQSRRHSVAGPGDTTISVRHDVGEAWTGEWFASVTGRVKLPTASAAKGLGSGAFDAALAADLLRPLGRVTIFAMAAHSWRGETRGVARRNTWNASAGGDVRLSPRWNVGASYDWRQISLGGDTGNVTAYARLRVRETLAVTAYGIAGLDNRGADYGGGLQVSVFGVW